MAWRQKQTEAKTLPGVQTVLWNRQRFAGAVLQKDLMIAKGLLLSLLVSVFLLWPALGLLAWLVWQALPRGRG